MQYNVDKVPDITASPVFVLFSILYPFCFLFSSPRSYRKLLLCFHYLHNVQMLMCVIMFDFMHEITCQVNGV